MAETVILDGISRNNTIGAATADPGNSSLDDASSGGSYSGGRAEFHVEIESLNEIFAAAAAAANSGDDDASSSGTYTGTTNSTFTIEIDGEDVGAATADSANTGVDDLTPGGTHSGGASDTYTVTIDATETGTITAFADGGSGPLVTVTDAAHGLSNSDEITISGTNNYDGTYTVSNVASDTFDINATFYGNDAVGTWEKTNEFSWSAALGGSGSAIAITTSAQTLQDGVTVTFAAKTGHAASDEWTFAVLVQDTFKWKKDAGSDTTGVKINPTGTISGFSDGGSGITTVAANAHGMENGDEVTIVADSSTGSVYDGDWIISNVSANAFDITTPYSVTDTAVWTRNRKLLSDGVLLLFTGNKGHDLGDIWTIAAQPDNFKWRKIEADDFTTGVAITKAAQTLSDGVTVTFTNSAGHAVGDIWTITILGDYTITMNTVWGNIQQMVVPENYKATWGNARLLCIDLQTGVCYITFDTEPNSDGTWDGGELSIYSAAELFASIGGLSTQEQGDLDDDLINQNPGPGEDPVRA
jgi:hypothetical protein